MSPLARWAGAVVDERHWAAVSRGLVRNAAAGCVLYLLLGMPGVGFVLLARDYFLVAAVLLASVAEAAMRRGREAEAVRLGVQAAADGLCAAAAFALALLAA